MKYKFMTAEDNAVIVHSELKKDGTVMFMLRNPILRTAFTI